MHLLMFVYEFVGLKTFIHWTIIQRLFAIYPLIQLQECIHMHLWELTGFPFVPTEASFVAATTNNDGFRRASFFCNPTKCIHRVLGVGNYFFYYSYAYCFTPRILNMDVVSFAYTKPTSPSGLYGTPTTTTRPIPICVAMVVCCHPFTTIIPLSLVAGSPLPLVLTVPMWWWWVVWLSPCPLPQVSIVPKWWHTLCLSIN